METPFPNYNLDVENALSFIAYFANVTRERVFLYSGSLFREIVYKKKNPLFSLRNYLYLREIIGNIFY